MRRVHQAQLLAVAAASAMLLTGCNADDAGVTVTASAPAEASQAAASPSASTTPSPPASEAPLPDPDPPADAAPFAADREPDTAEASAGAFLSPVNLRFGVHDGFDRIVLDLAGNGTPGWRGEYVAEPTFDGSGEPLSLLGEDYLRIAVKGVVYPTEDGAQPYVGPADFTPETGGVVEEVRFGSVFEGQVEVFIGLSSDEPFRVYALADPTRVVIDVQHP